MTLTNVIAIKNNSADENKRFWIPRLYQFQYFVLSSKKNDEISVVTSYVPLIWLKIVFWDDTEIAVFFPGRLRLFLLQTRRSIRSKIVIFVVVTLKRYLGGKLEQHMNITQKWAFYDGNCSNLLKFHMKSSKITISRWKCIHWLSNVILGRRRWLKINSFVFLTSRLLFSSHLDWFCVKAPHNNKTMEVNGVSRHQTTFSYKKKLFFLSPIQHILEQIDGRSANLINFSVFHQFQWDVKNNSSPFSSQTVFDLSSIFSKYPSYNQRPFYPSMGYPYGGGHGGYQGGGYPGGGYPGGGYPGGGYPGGGYPGSGYPGSGLGTNMIGIFFIFLTWPSKQLVVRSPPNTPQLTPKKYVFLLLLFSVIFLYLRRQVEALALAAMEVMVVYHPIWATIITITMVNEILAMDIIEIRINMVLCHHHGIWIWIIYQALAIEAIIERISLRKKHKMA